MRSHSTEPAATSFSAGTRKTASSRGACRSSRPDNGRSKTLGGFVMLHDALLRARGAKLFLVAVALLWLFIATVPTARAADPAQGPGGPILVVTSGSSTFGK